MRESRLSQSSSSPTVSHNEQTFIERESAGNSPMTLAHQSDESLRLKRGAATSAPQPVEIGGREGPEPTRYGDWEKAGRCIDF